MTRLCSQSSQAQGVLPALPGASEPLTRVFFQHAQLEIKAQKPNHRADTRMPNALRLKTQILESTALRVSATGGLRTQTFLLHQGLPKNLCPGCAAPPGSIHSPFVSLSAPSFALTRGAVSGPPQPPTRGPCPHLSPTTPGPCPLYHTVHDAEVPAL